MKQQITKTMLFAAAILLLSITITKAQSEKKAGYYFTTVSNPTKVVNYIIGLYSDDNLFQKTAADSAQYTEIKGVVINNSATDLTWNNYKIYILLKSGKLIRNYTTSATSGDYACNYSVTKGVNHHQFFCFHSTFTADDISKVWLSFVTDDQLFSLNYSPGKN